MVWTADQNVCVNMGPNVMLSMELVSVFLGTRDNTVNTEVRVTVTKQP